IFISATGTAADNLVITGASSTAANIIGISATTTYSGSANVTVAAFSLEFFGIR
ncbi:MAG: hypothetical protein HYT22_03690, partial [Candidatus Niyogibacteria bacterium]|nr:hypothetical protein [Candidatus Niyogibacteria bacterium]